MVSATSWPKTQALSISRTAGALLLGDMPRMLSVCSLGPGSDTPGPFPTPTLKENQTMMWFSLFAAPGPLQCARDSGSGSDGAHLPPQQQTLLKGKSSGPEETAQ